MNPSECVLWLFKVGGQLLLKNKLQVLLYYGTIFQWFKVTSPGNKRVIPYSRYSGGVLMLGSLVGKSLHFLASKCISLLYDLQKVRSISSLLKDSGRSLHSMSLTLLSL